jgi:cellulose synthase operon protein B
MIQFMKHTFSIALCVFCLTGHAQLPVTTAQQATAVRSETQGVERQRTLTFSEMGQSSGVRLTGTNRFVDLNSGIRLDELVTRASLNLKVLYPQGMRHDQSFIRVYVNDQLSALSQLSTSRAGVSHTMTLELDPTLFSDFATIRIEYDGTYDTECVDPGNPTLRVDIRPESALTIVSTPLNLVNDLALLPAPFFDPRDNRKLKLPLVLPAQRTDLNLKAAGILASWMGAQAFYRQAEFDLLDNASPTRHTIILTTGDKLPQGMDKTRIEGPSLMIVNAPDNPSVKHLYIMGRNEDELLQAVYGLVIEGQVLSGQKALVKKVELGAPRKPYDAPRYVPTDRPVRFGELIDFPGQLEVSADKPRAALSLRLPPDLFSWAGRNIPMDLKYRYTAPSRWNDSLLNIEINNALIQSFRLAPRSEQVQNKINIDLLGQAELSSEESLQIPAFRVGGNNELAFGFGFMAEGGGACTRVSQVARGSIDPESTLDFSNLPHYTRMPNLTAFANGGYPFSIMADLSDTAIVLPANPTALETRSFLNVMGLFGQWTGLPATRTTLIVSDKPEGIGGKNWLALGTSDRLNWLNEANMNLPMVLNNTERSMGLPPAFQWLKGLWQSDSELQPGNDTRALIQTAGSLGAIMGFESHWQTKKAGVIVTGTDQESFERAVAALSSYGDVAKIKGSVSLIRGNDIQSYSLGDTYISGALPWWLRLRIAFSEYPALIAIGGALAGVVLAILAFGWLSSRANRRTKGA